MSSSQNTSAYRYPAGTIEKIKYMRYLTKLLGKLGLKTCYIDNQGYIDFVKQQRAGTWNHKWDSNLPQRFTYGWGLKETKDAVVNYLDRKTGSTTA